MTNKKLALAIAAGMLLVTSFPTAAADDPWLVRARAVHLESANGGDLPLSINDKWLPELDISYFFTPHIAAELILTVPQKQDVSLSGAKIGTLRHLPPTLTDVNAAGAKVGTFKVDPVLIGVGVGYRS